MEEQFVDFKLCDCHKMQKDTQFAKKTEQKKNKAVDTYTTRHTHTRRYIR